MSTMADRHRNDGPRREGQRGEGGRAGRERDDAHHRRAEPTAPTRPVRAVDGEPPRAPHELEPDPAERRSFVVGDEEWIAFVAGKGAWGSGSYGLGMVVAVQFVRASAPDQPVREILVARGRFSGLFDDELRALLAEATPIVTDAQPRAESTRRERRSREW